MSELKLGDITRLNQTGRNIITNENNSYPQSWVTKLFVIAKEIPSRTETKTYLVKDITGQEIWNSVDNTSLEISEEYMKKIEVCPMKQQEFDFNG